jgi:predicted permease
VKQPRELVQVMLGERRASWSNPLWEQLRDHHADLFNGAFAFSQPRFNLAGGGETEFVNGVMASGGLFEVLGVPAILGRTFNPADDANGGGTDGPVAVISYGFWQRRFGGAADAIGKPLLLDRVSFTIIGVTPPDFTGPSQGRLFDVAIPLAAEPLIRGANESAMQERSWWWLNVMARLKPGDTMERATAALRGVQPQMRQATIPENYRTADLPRYLSESFGLRSASNGPAWLRLQYRQPLFTIMAVVAVVLLIACANIANLLLARASARRHELSVRLALGASPGRIARHLLVESLLLSVIGAMLAILFAYWGSRALVAQFSASVELKLPLDWRVLGFTAAVAIGTAMIFGTVPALRATRVEPNEAIKEQGRAIIGENRLGFGSALVVTQVALSLVLVVGAGLFVRTFLSLARMNLGFVPDPILIVDVNAKRSGVATDARQTLFERARQAVLAVPGVRSAGGSVITPIDSSSWDMLIDNPNGLSLPENERNVWTNAVSPDWFATYGIPLIAGRDFNSHDTLESPRVIVVNEMFANKYFRNQNPIGKAIREIDSPQDHTKPMVIVGLVKDAVYLSPRDGVPPTMYQAILQLKTRNLQTVTIAAQAASGAPMLLTRNVANAIIRVDPDLSLTFRPMKTTVREVTSQERVVASLSGFFGALALLLAGIGLYGVMSYAVSRRRTEIGIRMALGAAPASAIGLVLRRVAVLVGTGVIVGCAVALWAAQFVSSLLFGLPPRDPATFAGAAIVLTAIGALAAWIPARRAARIDPAIVLRNQ